MDVIQRSTKFCLPQLLYIRSGELVTFQILLDYYSHHSWPLPRLTATNRNWDPKTSGGSMVPHSFLVPYIFLFHHIWTDYKNVITYLYFYCSSVPHNWLWNTCAIGQYNHPTWYPTKPNSEKIYWNQWAFVSEVHSSLSMPKVEYHPIGLSICWLYRNNSMNM